METKYNVLFRPRYYDSLRTRYCSDAQLVAQDETVMAPFSVLPQMAVQALTQLKLFSDGRRVPHDFKQYVQLSGAHGRSMVNTVMTGRYLWHDIFGIPFTSVDLKGAMAIDVRLEEGGACTYDTRVKGLYELAFIPEAMQASKIIREKLGVPTEVLARVWKLHSIPTEKYNVKIEDLKQIWRIEKYARQLAHSLIGIDEPSPCYKDVREYLKHFPEFALVERHSQTPYRLSDSVSLTSASDCTALLAPLFWFINTVYAYNQKAMVPGLPPEPTLNIRSQADQKYFFDIWLPTHMGAYLAHWHNNNVVHGFPHRQNWTMLGTLVDLDSVDGPLVNPDFDGNLGEMKKVDFDKVSDFLEHSKPQHHAVSRHLDDMQQQFWMKFRQQFRKSYKENAQERVW